VHGIDPTIVSKWSKNVRWLQLDFISLKKWIDAKLPTKVVNSIVTVPTIECSVGRVFSVLRFGGEPSVRWKLAAVREVQESRFLGCKIISFLLVHNST
jgi:hypothetical protein